MDDVDDNWWRRLMAMSCGDVDSDVDADIERRNEEATSGGDVDDEVKGSVDNDVDDDVDVKVDDDVPCHVRRPHRLVKLDGDVGWRHPVTSSSGDIASSG